MKEGAPQMANSKMLLVGNRYRYYNLALITKSLFDKYTLVDEHNWQKIYDNLKTYKSAYLKEDPLALHSRNKIDYRIKDGWNIPMELVTALVHYGNSLTLLATQAVPKPILDLFARSKRCSVWFDYDSLDSRPNMVPVVKLVSQATETGVFLKVNPLSNPSDILFALYPYAYSIDHVYFSFDTLSKVDDNLKDQFVQYNGRWDLKPIYKFNYFKQLQAPLSIWKMYIHIVMGEDILQLKDLVFRDKKGKPVITNRKPMRKRDN